MKKKIQVSAVELQALSEVIVLNSSFVAKAVRTADAAKRIKKCIEDYSTDNVKDENGDWKKDENGQYVTELNVGTRNVTLDRDQVLDFYNSIEPFLTELVDALLGEE